MPWIANGSLMIVPTVLRGFSDEYGSWKIICMSWRSFLSRAPDASVMSWPSKRIEPEVGSIRRSSRRAVVDLPQPDSPTRPSVSPFMTSKEMPSTACTAPTLRWMMMPLVSGKCLTRSRTSISGSPPPGAGAPPEGLVTVSLMLPGPPRTRRPGRERRRCRPLLGPPTLRPPRRASRRRGRRPATCPRAGPPRACGACRDRAGRRPGGARLSCTASSGGSMVMWSGFTYGQRGWNEQPPGRLISDGGRPAIGTSSSSRGESSRGIDDSRPHV